MAESDRRPGREIHLNEHASAADRTAYAGAGALSALVVGFLFWLIYFQQSPAAGPPPWAAWLPWAKAAFNTCSALCLAAGFRAIRGGDRTRHQRLMLSALGFSAAFLASYVLYHSLAGDTPFEGQGWIRPVYFAVLISHVVTTMVALPPILITVFFALTGRFDRHRQVARWTFPLWMYVSVTGVVVFGMLRIW